jgi:hypothetical protein
MDRGRSDIGVLLGALKLGADEGQEGLDPLLCPDSELH